MSYKLDNSSLNYEPLYKACIERHELKVHIAKELQTKRLERSSKQYEDVVAIRATKDESKYTVKDLKCLIQYKKQKGDPVMPTKHADLLLYYNSIKGRRSPSLPPRRECDNILNTNCTDV